MAARQQAVKKPPKPETPKAETPNAETPKAETPKPGSGAAKPRPVALPSYFSRDRDDRLIYEKIRLGIVSALSVNRSLSFSELRDLLGTSDGNLSVHARKLEEAGYVGCKKSFSGRTPKTEYQLTAKGRKAFDRYLDHMEALIDMTRGNAAKPSGGTQQ